MGVNCEIRLISSIETHQFQDQAFCPAQSCYPISGANLEMTDRHNSDTEAPLAKVIVGMTISLDGFVADQNGNAGRLYPDLAALRYTAYMKDAIEQTGAVLMGRRTFEMGDPDSYVGNYHSKCRFSC